MSNEEQTDAREASNSADSTALVLQSLVRKVESLTESVEEARDEVRRSKGKKIEFKRKSHEIQHQVNSAAIEAMSSAVQCCSQGKLEKAQDLLNSGIEELEARNKLILIADSSECGWSTVEFFEKPDLFDNEADLAKFKSATYLAKAKKRNLEANRPKPFYNNRRMPFTGSFRQGVESATPFTNSFVPFNQSARTTVPYTAAVQRFPAAFNVPGFAQASLGASPQLLQCYACLNWGHVQANCPMRKAKQFPGK